MIALLLKLGLSERIAKAVAYIGIPLLILGMFYLALDAYGDSRYQAGRTDEEAAWKAAQDKLLQDAANAADEADSDAVGRALDHAAKVEEEKERISEAQASGVSPFDVLFPRSVQP